MMNESNRQTKRGKGIRKDEGCYRDLVVTWFKEWSHLNGALILILKLKTLSALAHIEHRHPVQITLFLLMKVSTRTTRG